MGHGRRPVSGSLLALLRGAATALAAAPTLGPTTTEPTPGSFHPTFPALATESTQPTVSASLAALATLAAIAASATRTALTTTVRTATAVVPTRPVRLLDGGRVCEPQHLRVPTMRLRRLG